MTVSLRLPPHVDHQTEDVFVSEVPVTHDTVEQLEAETRLPPVQLSKKDPKNFQVSLVP